MDDNLNDVMQNGGNIGNQVQIRNTVFGNRQHQEGVVYIKENIQGIVQTDDVLYGAIDNRKFIVGNVGYSKGQSDPPIYNGEYIVVPKKYEQSLATKNKMMKADVIIKEIPYYETSNLKGITVYIGGE